MEWHGMEYKIFMNIMERNIEQKHRMYDEKQGLQTLP